MQLLQHSAFVSKVLILDIEIIEMHEMQSSGQLLGSS